MEFCLGFPVEVADLDNDSLLDLVGFDRTGLEFQSAPTVTQFQQ